MVLLFLIVAVFSAGAAEVPREFQTGMTWGFVPVTSRWDGFLQTDISERY